MLGSGKRSGVMISTVSGVGFIGALKVYEPGYNFMHGMCASTPGCVTVHFVCCFRWQLISAWRLNRAEYNLGPVKTGR